MRILDNFKKLTTFEWILWIISLIVITISFLLVPEKNYLSLTASLIGATALIFIAKGMVFGQILIIIFALLYGFISILFRYYGEMITYVFMSAPMAVLNAIEWYKNPFKNTKTVAIKDINSKIILKIFIRSVVVTFCFYFILKWLNTNNLILSTISVTTSFIAASLSYYRSPYYALGYISNDIVLIVLWVLASIADIAYAPMIFCFVMFLFNDLYGYINWEKMKKKQKK